MCPISMSENQLTNVGHNMLYHYQFNIKGSQWLKTSLFRVLNYDNVHVCAIISILSQSMKLDDLIFLTI